MKKYLIDANLPSKIKIWQSEKFEFVININDEWSDSEIWNYAETNNLTIVTKDADFSHRIMVSDSPPKIIHIKIRNVKLREFESAVNKVWKKPDSYPKITNWSMFFWIESKRKNENHRIGSRKIISAVFRAIAAASAFDSFKYDNCINASPVLDNRRTRSPSSAFVS